MMMLVAYNTIHTLVDPVGPHVVVMYIGHVPSGTRDIIQGSDWLRSVNLT